MVKCDCGETHIIIPCEWLAFIREREWVPRSRGQERLADASLARLTRHNPNLAETVTREEHTDFLNLVGISVLEQAVLAAGEAQSAELRRKLAQLARLAVQHPEAVAQLIESADASGFNLEHIEDIRYGIRSEICDGKAVSLTEFVDWLGKQLSAFRR